jgi:hypothetical protein
MTSTRRPSQALAKGRRHNRFSAVRGPGVRGASIGDLPAHGGIDGWDALRRYIYRGAESRLIEHRLHVVPRLASERSFAPFWDECSFRRMAQRTGCHAEFERPACDHRIPVAGASTRLRVDNGVDDRRQPGVVTGRSTGGDPTKLACQSSGICRTGWRRGRAGLFTIHRRATLNDRFSDHRAGTAHCSRLRSPNADLRP